MPTVQPIVSNEREPKRRRQSGIYKILCKPTGKIYIGSAVWLAKRKRHHREAFLAGTHYNSYLQKAWNKYGADAFEFSVLEYCEKEKLIDREQYFIDTLNATDHRLGFNLQPKAGSNLGIVFGIKARENMSAAGKGKLCTLSPLQIEELRERMKGNSFRLGIKHTLETRKRLKKSREGKTPALGMRHTEEVKKKMSESRKGRTLTKEHRKKIALAHIGKKQTRAHRINLAIVQSKIKPDQFEKIKAEYIPGVVTLSEIAARYGCCTQSICNIINGKRMVI